MIKCVYSQTLKNHSNCIWVGNSWQLEHYVISTFTLMSSAEYKGVLPWVWVLCECGQAAGVHVSSYIDVDGGVGFSQLSRKRDALRSQRRHWRAGQREARHASSLLRISTQNTLSTAHHTHKHIHTCSTAAPSQSSPSWLSKRKRMLWACQHLWDHSYIHLVSHFAQELVAQL